MNEASSSTPGAVAAESFLNKTETGQRLGIRPRTLDDWMSRGLVPYYKLGRAVRFKWSEIERHLGATCRVARRTPRFRRA